ncbi:MAG: S-methyl-5'-thioadenosine phosphorylase [Coriobacteriia bacterium]
MTDSPSAEIGVFGGSGFYELLEVAREYEISTPYGAPSSPVTIGEIGGRQVAFLARHGRHHTIPPHMINYRANLSAMKQLGVTQIIGPTASGSLRPEIEPGHFVVCDQLVDRTWGRHDTFFDGPEVVHVSPADPYCPKMRAVAIEKIKAAGVTVHESGTVVVIQGPRFSTKAESRWFSSAGWHAINMTQYPEAYLARELALCYMNISIVTDYDCGTAGAKPTTNEDIVREFARSNERLKEVIFAMVPDLPVERECVCVHALDGASM